jgi:hypothetical protein
MSDKPGADGVAEFDCVDCGFHIFAFGMPPGPRWRCATCQFILDFVRPELRDEMRQRLVGGIDAEGRRMAEQMVIARTMTPEQKRRAIAEQQTSDPQEIEALMKWMMENINDDDLVVPQPPGG